MRRPLVAVLTYASRRWPLAKLEFFYDIASPYSYLAAVRVEAIAADCGAELSWRPFLLGAVFRDVGNQPPALVPARGRYMFKDLKRWAAYYGVPFHFPSVFPTNSLLAMRALTALDNADRAEASLALFHAYWADNRDAGDPEIVLDVLGAATVERASDPAVKQALKDTSAEAVERGTFGAPTFFVGKEMWFGNDRLPFVEQALRASRG